MVTHVLTRFASGSHLGTGGRRPLLLGLAWPVGLRQRRCWRPAEWRATFWTKLGARSDLLPTARAGADQPHPALLTKPGRLRMLALTLGALHQPAPFSGMPVALPCTSAASAWGSLGMAHPFQGLKRLFPRALLPHFSHTPSNLVVKSQVADIIDLILQLIGHPNGVHRPCRNRKSRGAVLSTSEGQWATTKSSMQAGPAPPRMKTGRNGIFVGIRWSVEFAAVYAQSYGSRAARRWPITSRAGGK
jgi:hypothetical protein